MFSYKVWDLWLHPCPENWMSSRVLCAGCHAYSAGIKCLLSTYSDDYVSLNMVEKVMINTIPNLNYLYREEIPVVGKLNVHWRPYDIGAS